MEVMGLMLGEFIDDYTVRVIDVFAMPQSGTGVSVEAVDPVFQTKMLDMLKQTGRCATRRTANDQVAGPRPNELGARPWRVAQAGDGRRVVPLAPGLWLLAVRRGHQHAAGAASGWSVPGRARRPDVPRWRGGGPDAPLQSFEALNQRAVAVVIDPIQSVKGKVVIDAFRLISPQTIMMNQEPRQTTSNIGHLNKPSIQVRRAGLRARRRRR